MCFRPRSIDESLSTCYRSKWRQLDSGRVGDFSPERETFRSNVERMDMFFMANNIVEEQGESNEDANLSVQKRKCAIFLIEIGPKAYSTLSHLFLPAKTTDTPFAGIVEALERHYNPAPLEIAESFHFGSRYQKRDESMGNFSVAIKKSYLFIVTMASFSTEFLNRALYLWIEKSQNTEQAVEY